MTDEPALAPDAAIDAYLRANAGRYPHQALDAQLRAAGHPDAAIAAAWERVGAGSWGPPPPRPTGGFAAFVMVVGIVGIIVVYGLSGLIAGLALLLTGGGSLGSEGWDAGAAVILLAYLAALAVAGFALCRMLLRLERRRARWPAMAGAIILSAAVWVALSAACFVVLDSFAGAGF